MVAETAMVYPPEVLVDRYVPTPSGSRPIDAKQGDGIPSGPDIPESDGVENTPVVMAILDRARKPSAQPSTSENLSLNIRKQTTYMQYLLL